MSANPRSTGFEAFKKLITTPELPDLGPGPRANVKSRAALDKRLEDYFATANPRKPTRELLRCAALLWHDHHDAAHAIAQEDSSAEGSFLHGILHRREPDYDNARYWFRRVGKHPALIGDQCRGTEAIGEKQRRPQHAASGVHSVHGSSREFVKPLLGSGRRQGRQAGKTRRRAQGAAAHPFTV